MNGEIRWPHWVGAGILLLVLIAGVIYRLGRQPVPRGVAARAGSAPASAVDEGTLPPPRR